MNAEVDTPTDGRARFDQLMTQLDAIVSTGLDGVTTVTEEVAHHREVLGATRVRLGNRKRALIEGEREQIAGISTPLVRLRRALWLLRWRVFLHRFARIAVLIGLHLLLFLRRHWRVFVATVVAAGLSWIAWVVYPPVVAFIDSQLPALFEGADDQQQNPMSSHQSGVAGTSEPLVKSDLPPATGEATQ